MSVCSSTKRDGHPCTLPAMAGSPWCWNHDPACAEERRRNASHAATAKHSKISQEIRDVRQTVKELIFLTISNELHPLVRKRLTEVVQLLQTYARLTELEIASMEAEGKKLPVFNAREVLDLGLPGDTAGRVREWAEGEQEKAERREEGERVLKEVAGLAEGRGYDAGDMRRFMK